MYLLACSLCQVLNDGKNMLVVTSHPEHGVNITLFRTSEAMPSQPTKNLPRRGDGRYMFAVDEQLGLLALVSLGSVSEYTQR